MKFPVTLTRTVHQSLDIEIEAKNAEEAHQIALNTAGDYDFSGLEKSAEYEAIVEQPALKEHYENGECPYCGDPIPDDMVDGGECANCGHVFWLPS